MADRGLWLLAFGGALFPNGQATIDPGVADRSSAACAGCHADEHADWSTSRHAVASTNPTFLASIADARLRGWCLNCHAPLGPEVADEGVSCVACHVRDGLVLAREPVDPAATAVHPVRVEPDLADSRFCGGCHQFRAPLRDTGKPGGDWLQDTVREWQAWGGADTCQTCHLPAGRHTFGGGHDADLLRASVVVEPTRVDSLRVRFVLASQGVGHDLPTGDPFRRLVLTTCADADCAEVIDTASFWREFSTTRSSWRMVTDHTLPPGIRTEVDLDAAGASAWRLELRFGDPAFEPALPPDEVRVVVAEGPLPP